MTMDYEKFEAQRKYCAAVSIGMTLKKERLITGAELKTIKHRFAKKYEPLIKTIGDEPAPTPSAKKHQNLELFKFVKGFRLYCFDLSG